MYKFVTHNASKAVFLFFIAFSSISITVFKIITIERYLQCFLFLLIVAIVLFLTFKKSLIHFVKRTNKTAFILIVLSLIVHGIITHIITTYLQYPTWPFDTTSLSLLMMNGYFIWVKPLDVFVQQLLIVILVKELHNSYLRPRHVLVSFFIGFGLFHNIQIFRVHPIVALFFSLVTLAFSLIFPYMILTHRKGHVYNYLIHLGIYDISALIAWIIF